MEFEETVEMPSMGILEGSLESIQIRSMTVKDEKILFKKNRGMGEKLLLFMINCTDVRDRKVAIKFPVADVMLAFLKVRNLSVGSSEHQFKIQCSVCSKTFPYRVDINRQDIKYLEDDAEPYEVHLPKCDKVVQLNYMRLGDQVLLDRELKKRVAKGADDGLFVAERFATLTHSVGGEEKAAYDSKCQFYENLHLSDMNFLIDAVADKDFGLDLRVYAECPHCTSVEEYLVRMDPSFFRPPRKLR